MFCSGVGAPAKQIADTAGVGVGTLYRHFPRRSDLVKAVFQREVDACADAAPTLMAENPPGVALEKWLYRFTEFVATKHGLADALHSGDPAFDDLPAYFMSSFGPALESLLKRHQPQATSEPRSAPTSSSSPSPVCVDRSERRTSTRAGGW